MVENYVVTALGGFAPSGRGPGLHIYPAGSVLSRSELLGLCPSLQFEKLVRAKVITPQDRVVANPKLWGRAGSVKAPDGHYGHHSLVTGEQEGKGTPPLPHGKKPKAKPEPEPEPVVSDPADLTAPAITGEEADKLRAALEDDKPETFTVQPQDKPVLPAKRRPKA